MSNKGKSIKVFNYEITEAHVHFIVVAYAVIMSFASYDNLFGKIIVATPKLLLYAIGIWQSYLAYLLLRAIKRGNKK